MPAVLLVARCELQRRLRSALALAVLLGLVGGIVLASAAGAHRSATALARFIAYSRASDTEVDVTDPTPAELRAFARIPQVEDFAVLHVYALSPVGRPDLKNAATVDGRLGTAIDRARVIAGRAANPRAVDEVAIGEALAAQEHLRIGGHIDANSITPAQFATVNGGGGKLGPPAGPHIRLRIVGIVRRPLDLGDLAASGGVIIETPAFDRAYTGRMARFTTVLRVRTRHGAADDARIATASRRLFGRRFSSISDVSAESHGGADAINVLTLALWVFAAVAALAGAAAIAIMLSRDLSRTDVDQDALAALGLTRRQRGATVGLRAALIAVGGIVIAASLAIAVSPMFPIGIARRAEPAPGVRVDALVLGIGLAGMVVFVALIASFSARRATRRSSASVATGTRRSRPTLAALANRTGLRPPVTNGLRLAFEPGHGRTALPVRSALFGAVSGLVALTAVLVFAASLGHLDSTPRLYGWTWDFKAPDNSHTGGCGARQYGLTSKPGVAAVAAICYQSAEIDGRPTTAWGFTPVRGAIEPGIVAGRAPETSDEVALGATTLHAVGKKIGDTVTVRGQHGTRKYRVVGQVVLPQLRDGDEQPLASGAAFTGAGFAPIFDGQTSTRYLVGDFAPGSDPATVLRAVDAIPQFQAVPELGVFATDVGAARAIRPPEVARLRGIDWFPPLLAVLIAVLALVAVGHALVTTAHRRRSELALLKTLGFERRQVRATLAWQATALATVGLVAGIPIGLLVGNAVWSRVADSLGIAPVTVLPALALTVTVPCAIALAVLLGMWPARTAARAWPARVLRAE